MSRCGVGICSLDEARDVLDVNDAFFRSLPWREMSLFTTREINNLKNDICLCPCSAPVPPCFVRLLPRQHIMDRKTGQTSAPSIFWYGIIVTNMPQNYDKIKRMHQRMNNVLMIELREWKIYFRSYFQNNWDYHYGKYWNERPQLIHSHVTDKTKEQSLRWS